MKKVREFSRSNFFLKPSSSSADTDQPNKRNVLPPGMSPQASMPSDDQESQGSDPIEPSRPHFSPPARNPQAAGQRSPTRTNKPIMSSSSRNPVAVNPTSSRNRNPNQPMTNTPNNNNHGVTQGEPLQNIDNNQEEATAPISNNDNIQEEPIQTMNPDQPDGNAPMNNNDPVPIENNVGVPQEQLIPNPSRIPPSRNAPMRNSGHARVAPPQNQIPMSSNPNMIPTSDTAQNLPPSNGPLGKSSNQPGPANFGGSNWPDFFRQPHATANNVAPSNVPMASSPPAGGEQMVPSQTGQNTASVDQLLNKLNTLFGSNQGGNAGVGR